MKETFYISHGSPMLSVDDSLPARNFLKSFLFPVKPKSILMISAHWETTFPTLNAIDGTSDTIYDFYNFPKPLYQVLLNCFDFLVSIHKLSWSIPRSNQTYWIFLYFSCW